MKTYAISFGIFNPELKGVNLGSDAPRQPLKYSGAFRYTC
jgi:hypothetical protein